MSDKHSMSNLDLIHPSMFPTKEDLANYGQSYGQTDPNIMVDNHIHSYDCIPLEDRINNLKQTLDTFYKTRNNLDKDIKDIKEEIEKLNEELDKESHYLNFNDFDYETKRYMSSLRIGALFIDHKTQKVYQKQSSGKWKICRSSFKVDQWTNGSFIEIDGLNGDAARSVLK